MTINSLTHAGPFCFYNYLSKPQFLCRHSLVPWPDDAPFSCFSLPLWSWQPSALQVVSELIRPWLVFSSDLIWPWTHSRRPQWSQCFGFNLSMSLERLLDSLSAADSFRLSVSEFVFTEHKRRMREKLQCPDVQSWFKPIHTDLWL